MLAEATALGRLGFHSVLGKIPPAVSSSERNWNRQERVTLAQLRTGRCRRLNDYQHMIGQIESAVCPECLFRRHTARHIFDCEATPTNLVFEDLWNKPENVIVFLRSLSSFTFLQPEQPPLPPEPPPQPPLPP